MKKKEEIRLDKEWERKKEMLVLDEHSERRERWSVSFSLSFFLSPFFLSWWVVCLALGSFFSSIIHFSFSFLFFCFLLFLHDCCYQERKRERERKKEEQLSYRFLLHSFVLLSDFLSLSFSFFLSLSFSSQFVSQDNKRSSNDEKKERKGSPFSPSFFLSGQADRKMEMNWEKAKRAEGRILCFFVASKKISVAQFGLSGLFSSLTPSYADGRQFSHRSFFIDLPIIFNLSICSGRSYPSIRF